MTRRVEAIRGPAGFTPTKSERFVSWPSATTSISLRAACRHQGRGRTFVQRRFLPPRRNVRNVRKDTRHPRRNQELGIEWRQIPDVRYGLRQNRCADMLRRGVPGTSRIMADQACRYCSFLSLPTRRTPIRALRYAHARAIENDVCGHSRQCGQPSPCTITWTYSMPSRCVHPATSLSPYRRKRAEATPNTEMILRPMWINLSQRTAYLWQRPAT